jgi:hypothetical protein
MPKIAKALMVFRWIFSTVSYLWRVILELTPYVHVVSSKITLQRYDMIERIHRFHDLISYWKIYQKSKKKLKLN